MAKIRFDAVIDAVHYESDSKLKWVRAYLRRGPIFSDRVLLDRQSLIEQLKSGKKVYTGKRVPLMAGTFELSQPIRVVNKDNQEILVAGESQSEADLLEGIGVI